MISVPSHQQLLNGSKLIVLFVFVSLISSCELFKGITNGGSNKGNNSDTTYVSDNDPQNGGIKDPKDAERNLVIIGSVDSKDETTGTYTGANTEAIYDIGLMLPFKANQNKVTAEYLSKEDKRTLEFYEGVMMGLQDLKNEGKSFNVYVHDTENATYKIDQIFARGETQNLDLIIGPIYNNNVKRAAELARTYNIPLVNPLSPKENLANNNAFFLQNNASIETHSKAIYDYIQEAHRPNKIIVLVQNRSNDIRVANLFRDYANQRNGELGVATQVVVIYDEEMDGKIEIEDYLDELQENIVVVPSFNENFVGEAISQIAIHDRKFDFQLFGLPVWQNFQTLSFERLQSLNTHISSSFHVNEQLFEVIDVSNRYKWEYTAAATNYVLQGYDLVTYFGNALHQFGSNFIYNLPSIEDKSLNGYGFAPKEKQGLVGNTGEIDYLENKNVHILKFENYELVKVN